jgi:(p)ppGpp synthase/HD superfamily hydrolase
MTYSVRFEDALVYAARLHRDQVRKSTGVPYMGHLLGATSIVIDAGGTEDEAISTVLHDGIEDQGGDPVRQDIRKIFGAEVERIVSACSDTDVFPKPPWKDRKIAHIQHMKTIDNSVRIVVIADKLHNLRELVREYRKTDNVGNSKAAKAAVWAPFKGGRDGTVWYYQCMSLALARSGEDASPLRDLSWDLVDEASRFNASVYMAEPELKIDKMP